MHGYTVIRLFNIFELRRLEHEGLDALGPANNWREPNTPLFWLDGLIASANEHNTSYRALSYD